MVRAKFMVTSMKESKWSKGSKSMFTVELTAQYDQSIPEDRRFAEATPSGTLTMVIDNPKALEFLKLGETFYIDLVRAES